MSTDLERRLASLAQQWDESVAPIVWDELRGRASGLGPDPVAVPSVEASELSDVSVLSAVPFAPPHRAGRARWKGVVAGLAAATLLVSLMVVIGRGDHAPTAPSDTVPPTTLVEPTTLPEPTATASVTSLPSTTIDASTTTAAPTTGGAAEALPDQDRARAQLAAIEAERATRLATFDSFRVTATVSSEWSGGPDASVPFTHTETSTTVVTLRHDGSMWAVPGDGTPGFSAYDATTGVARVVWADADGALAAQEVVGWADNHVPLLIAVGFDPAAGLAVYTTITSIQQITSHLGRPAWSISSDGTGLPPMPGKSDAYHQESTIVVDRETGLVVGSESTWGDPVNGEQHATQRLDDLTLDVDLPPGFPGTFPDGIVVARSGDPAAFASLTVDEALARFGAPFAQPTDRDVERISIAQTPWQFPDAESTNLSLTLTSYRGFATTSIVFDRLVPVEGAPVPAYAAAVDGSWCLSDDGVHCYDVTGDTVGDVRIDGGPYAGANASWSSGSLVFWAGGVQVRVFTPSLDDALALVRSLEVVDA